LNAAENDDERDYTTHSFWLTEEQDVEIVTTGTIGRRKEGRNMKTFEQP
jgi:hypothetical protein